MFIINLSTFALTGWLDGWLARWQVRKKRKRKKPNQIYFSVRDNFNAHTCNCLYVVNLIHLTLLIPPENCKPKYITFLFFMFILRYLYVLKNIFSNFLLNEILWNFLSFLLFFGLICIFTHTHAKKTEVKLEFDKRMFLHIIRLKFM